MSDIYDILCFGRMQDGMGHEAGHGMNSSVFRTGERNSESSKVCA
jgi:hypothetical protein